MAILNLKNEFAYQTNAMLFLCYRGENELSESQIAFQPLRHFCEIKNGWSRGENVFKVHEHKAVSSTIKESILEVRCLVSRINQRIWVDKWRDS